MIRMPERKASTSSAAVCAIDVVPTILSIAGVNDYAEHYDYLRGKNALAPEPRSHKDPDLNGATLFQFAKPGRKPGKGKGKGKGKKGNDAPGGEGEGKGKGKGKQKG